MRRGRVTARPQDWLLRLEEVRRTGDRRAAPALLELLVDESLDPERRVEVAQALRALEDVRCAEPLLRAVLDTELSCEIRSLALEVHAAVPVDSPPRAQVLAWARSGDVVIRAFGVRLLDAPDGALLATAAADPAPLVRCSAVDAMGTLVRTPELVLATRRALGDDDAAIREAACRVALFDEPLDATHELIRALDDASCAVRIAACDALEDYPRISSIFALAQARGAADAPGLAAHLAFDGVTQRVRTSLEEASPRARRRLERWAEPIRWLLAKGASHPSADPEPEDGKGLAEDVSDESSYDPVDLDEAAAALSDDEAPPAVQRRLLVYGDWTESGAAGVAILRACASSPNWALRQGATFALSDLRAADELVALASDREPIVRRAALEELCDLDEPRGLPPAHDTLCDPVMRATAGDQALGFVAHLGTPAEAERAILAELGREGDEDGLWLGAIGLARHFGIEAAVPHLVRIAESPVVASVRQHVAALEALRALGRRRPGADLSHLEALDHLDVQRELGEWDWHGPRYG